MKAVRAGGKLLPLCQAQLKKLQKHVVFVNRTGVIHVPYICTSYVHI